VAFSARGIAHSYLDNVDAAWGDLSEAVRLRPDDYMLWEKWLLFSRSASSSGP
jgi:hypothetical protein